MLFIVIDWNKCHWREKSALKKCSSILIFTKFALGQFKVINYIAFNTCYALFQKVPSASLWWTTSKVFVKFCVYTIKFGIKVTLTRLTKSKSPALCGYNHKWLTICHFTVCLGVQPGSGDTTLTAMGDSPSSAQPQGNFRARRRWNKNGNDSWQEGRRAARVQTWI